MEASLQFENKTKLCDLLKFSRELSTPSFYIPEFLDTHFFDFFFQEEFKRLEEERNAKEREVGNTSNYDLECFLN